MNDNLEKEFMSGIAQVATTKREQQTKDCAFKQRFTGKC
jgi:hypothetical protein